MIGKWLVLYADDSKIDRRNFRDEGLTSLTCGSL
jgi:hypothetical protein